jgi:hypothetical protein
MPLPKTVAVAATLHAEPNDESPVIAEVQPGEPFDMLDNSMGWAWGYAGTQRRVGYIRSEAVDAGA